MRRGGNNQRQRRQPSRRGRNADLADLLAERPTHSSPTAPLSQTHSPPGAEALRLSSSGQSLSLSSPSFPTRNGSGHTEAVHRPLLRWCAQRCVVITHHSLVSRHTSLSTRFPMRADSLHRSCGASTVNHHMKAPSPTLSTSSVMHPPTMRSPRSAASITHHPPSAAVVAHALDPFPLLSSPPNPRSTPPCAPFSSSRRCSLWSQPSLRAVSVPRSPRSRPSRR